MRQPYANHCLLALYGHLLKYFLLSIASGTVACLVASVLGVGFLVEAIAAIVPALLWRGVALMLCLGAMTVMVESLLAGDE
ncbi:MAG: hypothetical protein ACFCVB_14300 [Nodosilinea sp.]